MSPNQIDVPRVLAALAEACHLLIPPEDLDPIIKHIVDNFISERNKEEAMVMGLNTISVIC